MDNAGARPSTRRSLGNTVVGAVLGALVIGPGLGSGSLLNFDLVAVEHLPMPREAWGLGPNIGRSLPFSLVLSAAADLFGGTTATKAFLLAMFGVCFAGAYRMASTLKAPVWGAYASALLYSLNPWLLTRVSVGHLTFCGAYATLPWVHQRLTRPSHDPTKTFLALAALATMGVYGGLLGGFVVAGGLAVEQRRRVGRTAVAWLASQSIWLAPGIVLLSQTRSLAGGSNFPSGIEPWLGPFQIVTGHGFWQSTLQIGGDSTFVLVGAGAALFALGVAGMSKLPRSWRQAMAPSAAAAVVLVLAEALPGAEWAYDLVTDQVGLGVLRTAHRLLPLVLLPVAVAVPFGAARLAEHLTAKLNRLAMLALPATVAVMLALPGLWGLEGTLEPVTIPTAWETVRENTKAGGTVLVLPWNRYQNVAIADGRRTLNPAIKYFGPDVLVSGGLELTATDSEVADPRTKAVEALLPSMRDGSIEVEALSDLGIRWVVIFHDANYQPFLGLLNVDELVSVVVDPSIDLLEVTTWRGELVSVASGDPGSLTHWSPAAAQVRIDAPSRWAEPWSPGWMHGFARASRSEFGTVDLTGDSGWVWHWPSLFVVLATGFWVISVTRSGYSVYS